VEKNQYHLKQRVSPEGRRGERGEKWEEGLFANGIKIKEGKDQGGKENYKKGGSLDNRI